MACGGMATSASLRALPTRRIRPWSKSMSPHLRPVSSAARSPVRSAVDSKARSLTPRGVVRVGNETWTAVSEDGNVIGVGEQVKVSKVDGLIVTVSRQNGEET